MVPDESEHPALSGTYQVDHLGVVVPDLAAAMAFYRDVLGCPVSAPKPLGGQGIAVAFVPFGNLRIELIAPTVDPSPISHVLENHTVNDFLRRQPGGGLHHVCYVVDDLPKVRDRLKAAGLRTLGSGEPIIGASGLPILFLDPVNPAGTLIELKQRQAPAG
jgi:methylmalonyl-CoA/ethylmalonyl-CoA epimerase